MINVIIPKYGNLKLEFLVLDFNGTIAEDGKIFPGVKKYLNKLSSKLSVYVITADTFGKAKNELDNIDCKLIILKQSNEKEAKLKFIQAIGPEKVISIGNGKNDSLMLKYSAVGIAVILTEGVSSETLFSADIICNNVFSALEILLNPKRLLATLRS